MIPTSQKNGGNKSQQLFAILFRWPFSPLKDIEKPTKRLPYILHRIASNRIMSSSCQPGGPWPVICGNPARELGPVRALGPGADGKRGFLFEPK